MTAYYGLVGAGGHGKEIMPVIRDMLRARGVDQPELRFLIEPGYDFPAVVSGVEVLTFEQFGALTGEKSFAIAIGTGKARERIAGICLTRGWKPLTIAGQTSLVYQSSQLGEGAMLSPFTLIGPDARIGNYFLANAYASVMHDCVIGDYVSFMPGVRCNGNVTIGDHVYVGSGAVLRNGITIGEGATIGMGAVVVKDVAAGNTVAGNPARPMIARSAS